MQQQAKTLYFQTDLTKSQIADLLKIERGTLHLWVKENHWERLRKNAQHLPSMLAENCYYILGHLTRSLLAENREMRPVTKQEADTLHKLTLTINKLKDRATINESMETFTYFLEMVNIKAPQLLDPIKQLIDEFVTSRAGKNMGTYMPEKFNDHGYLPVEKQNADELRLDIQDIMKWTEDEHPLIIPQSEEQSAPALASTPTQQRASEPAPTSGDSQSHVGNHKSELDLSQFDINDFPELCPFPGEFPVTHEELHDFINREKKYYAQNPHLPNPYRDRDQYDAKLLRYLAAKKQQLSKAA